VRSTGPDGADSPVIRIHAADNVVIARRQLLGGTPLAGEGSVVVAGLVPPGHKVASCAIAAGEPVRRYGQVIGTATQAIAPGQHVHTHNLAFADFQRAHQPGAGVVPTVHADTPATFEGIVRADGRVATRNYIGVLTSVNCSATAARAIADHFRRDVHPEALADFPNVDGVVALTHGMGCATDSDGEELQVLRRTLGGYARHANFAGVLIVGLGCETNQIQGLVAQEGLGEGAMAAGLQHPGHRRHGQDRGARRGELIQGDAARGQPRAAPAGAGPPPHGGPAVRRQRRLQRHQRQPGAGRGGGPPGAPRRHRHPQRDARDLRRRAPADPPRRQPRGGGQAAGAHRAGGSSTPRATA
jgi:altronate hydrolase